MMMMKGVSSTRSPCFFLEMMFAFLLAVFVALGSGADASVEVTTLLLLEKRPQQQHRRIIFRRLKGNYVRRLEDGFGDEEDSDENHDDFPQKADRDCDDYSDQYQSGNGATSTFGSMNPCRDGDNNNNNDGEDVRVPGDGDSDQNEDDAETISTITVGTDAPQEGVAPPPDAQQPDAPQEETQPQPEQVSDNHVSLTVYVALRPEQSSLGAVVTNLISGYLNATNPKKFVVIWNERRRQRLQLQLQVVVPESLASKDEDEDEDNFFGDRDDDMYQIRNHTRTHETLELWHLRTESTLYDAQEEWWWWQYDLLYKCFYSNSSGLLVPVTNMTTMQTISDNVHTLVHNGMETGHLYMWMRDTYHGSTFGALDFTTDPNDTLTSTPSWDHGSGAVASNGGDNATGSNLSDKTDNQVFLTVYMAFLPKEPSKRDLCTEFLSTYIQSMKPELIMILGGGGGGVVGDGQDVEVLPTGTVDPGTGVKIGVEGKQQQRIPGSSNGGAGGGHDDRVVPLLEEEGSNSSSHKSWDMVHQGTHSADIVKAPEFWWWEYDIVYNCFWTESKKPITNRTKLNKMTAEMIQIVQDGAASGSIYEWLKNHSKYQAAMGVLNITTNSLDVMVRNDGSPSSSSSSDSSDADDEDFGYNIPMNQIAEYSTPLDPNEWDWRRYLGLGLFVGTILMTFVLMQVAACRHRELKKQEVWGNLATERGVDELLRTGWKLKDNQMEIFDKTKLGYDDDQGSMFIGGFEQREAPTEITLTLLESTTTPETHHFPISHGTGSECTPTLEERKPLHNNAPRATDNSHRSEMTPETHHCSGSRGTEYERTPSVEESQQPVRNRARKANDGVSNKFEYIEV